MAFLLNINFACRDPDRLADFWAAALGYVKEDVPAEVAKELEAAGLEPDVAAAIRDPRMGGPRIYFEKKRGSRIVEAPDMQVGCGRDLEGRFAGIHLDVAAKDREAEMKRLLTLGATLVEERSQSIGQISETFIVMRDPEGNAFCLH